MKNALMVALTCVIAVAVFLAPIPGIGQDGPPAAAKEGGKGGFGGGGKGKAPAPPAGPMPRTPDGHPDFTGYWNGPAITDINAPGRGGAPGTIVDPPDGKIPYRPEAAAKAKDTTDNHMADEPTLHCFQNGIPKTMWVQFGFQVLQGPKDIVMTWELMRNVRIIPLDNRPHINSTFKLFQGDSVGHWEGDTLVVETTNHESKNWYDDGGNFKPQTVKVVEKFIPQNANLIIHEATMTDPLTYTAPWTTRVNLTRQNGTMKGAGNTTRAYEQMEFGCIEGNQDLEHYTTDKGGKAKLVIQPTKKQ